MKQKDFEDKMKQAAKEFSEKKKSPTTPAKQFEKGALWAWKLLMEAHASIYYEEILRADLMDREGKVDQWKESLIIETAAMMAERDAMNEEISKTGRLIRKVDKNFNEYKESNPLYVHLKELQRTIGMQREHLGLSNKVNVSRIKESPKQGVDDTDPMVEYYNSKRQ